MKRLTLTTVERLEERAGAATKDPATLTLCYHGKPVTVGAIVWPCSIVINYTGNVDPGEL